MKPLLSTKKMKTILLLALLGVTAVMMVPYEVLHKEKIVETYIKEPLLSNPAPTGETADIPEKKAPQPLSDRIVEYHISVQLDAEKKKLLGTQTLTWRNPGEKPVGELYFHLYPNAFQSKESTFVRESGGKLRNDEMKEGSFGGMQMTTLNTVDGEDLTRRTNFVQPDDGNTDDQTLMRVRLLEPVQPNAKVTLHMSFTVQLPHAFARMGYVDDFVMAGQWFPKIAVYEPAGTRGRAEEGWNLHQYHGNSEFYADFGIYNVQVIVPADYLVAATGFPTKPALQNGRTKTYHFYADDVHDFAWAASPHFVYVEEPYSTEQVPGVKIKLYLDPMHENLKDRYLRVAKRSLALYSKWYGAYPYSTLSIVVPPKGGNGAGGMEYPTLVTGWEATQEEPELELERVIAHEIGHQFWYGMVATNEFEEAWLDEGFTSYTEDKLMEAEYEMKSNTPVESSYITSPAPLKQLSWKYVDHNEYADNVYTRAKLVLRGIEAQIGPDQMSKVLQTYFDRWKFKHPDTRDFQLVLEDVTKKDWTAYFQQFVYKGLMVDYAVERIRIRKTNEQGERAYESTVLITKQEGTHSGIPIVFHFSDGKTRKKLWSGKEDRMEFKLLAKAPIDWVAIDPHYSIVLENKHINNFMKTTLDEKWKIRWNLGVVKFIEALLSWVAW